MDYIAKLQKKMENKKLSKEYIRICTSYAKNLIDNNMPVIFDFHHLSLLLGLKPYELSLYLFSDESLFYNHIKIPKKSGGYRDIDVPSNKLKKIQKWILNNILLKIEVHEKCFGFCKGKSIYDNASKHVGNDCVLNLDLKDFFPSISQKDVFYIFYNRGYTKKVSYYLAKLLTRDGKLPQGSPASPMVSNIVAKNLDKRLNLLAISWRANYSRYADDITFSGSEKVIELIPIISKIVEEEHFIINEKKTRYSYYYQRQEVTGLIVNKKVNIPKSFIKELKKEIYFCKKYGVSSHLEKIECNKSFFKEYLYGKVYFINMINKKLGNSLLKQLNEIEWDY